jgi:hypothetical protein
LALFPDFVIRRPQDRAGMEKPTKHPRREEAAKHLRSFLDPDGMDSGMGKTKSHGYGLDLLSLPSMHQRGVLEDGQNSRHGSSGCALREGDTGAQDYQEVAYYQH